MSPSQRDTSKPSRTRRATYVFGLTAILLASSIYFTAFPTTSGIASNFVDQAFGVIQIVVIAYLTTGSIDNADILTRFTTRRPRIGGNIPNKPYPNDPPDDCDDAVDPRDSIHDGKRGNDDGTSNRVG